MSTQKILNANIEIKTVVQFEPQHSDVNNNYYFFSYRIFVSNNGNDTVQLMSRHWIITDSYGQIEEVKGPGVVGLQPHIKPKETFQYESGCGLNTKSGSMKGFYQFKNSQGDFFEVEIPEFFMIHDTLIH
jgi:ApaG protein